MDENEWRVPGLGWAWGAWCGAAWALTPDLVLLPITLSGWWLFRRVAPVLFPFWGVLVAGVALWHHRPLPEGWEQGFYELEGTHGAASSRIAHGTLMLSPTSSWEVGVRRAPAIPGLYAIQRHAQGLDWQLCAPSSDWRGHWKEKWKELLSHSMASPRAADLYAAMATGEVDSPALRALLGRFGMSHLLALSGLHVTLVVGMIGRGLRLLGLFGHSLLIMQGLALLAYLVAVGPYASALRAGGMSLLALLGSALGRKTSTAHVLGVTMAVLLVWDPDLCIHFGFQLSCGATLGLVCWSRPLAQALQRLLCRPEPGIWWIRRFLIAVAKIAACNFSVLPLTIPILIWRFHEWNLLGLWINALFAPLLAWGFSLSLFAPLTAGLLGTPLGLVTDWILDLLEVPWWWDLWTTPCSISVTECLFACWGCGLAAMGLSSLLGRNSPY